MNRRGKLLVSRSLHFPSRFPSCTIQNLSQNCLDMRCFTLPSGRRHIDCCQTALRWRVRHLHLVGGGPPPRPSGQSIGVIPPARVVARTIYAVSSFHLLLFRGKMFSSFSNCGVTVFVTSTTLFSESCKCRNISTASCAHIPPHSLTSQILPPALLQIHRRRCSPRRRSRRSICLRPRRVFSLLSPAQPGILSGHGRLA
jgi:hypothetical protein